MLVLFAVQSVLKLEACGVLFSQLNALPYGLSSPQRDQMYAAQEMFKTANKVTRPEKALILGFMAGSRGTAVHQLPDQIYHFPGKCYYVSFDCIISNWLN